MNAQLTQKLHHFIYEMTQSGKDMNGQYWIPRAVKLLSEMDAEKSLAAPTVAGAVLSDEQIHAVINAMPESDFEPTIAIGEITALFDDDNGEDVEVLESIRAYAKIVAFRAIAAAAPLYAAAQAPQPADDLTTAQLSAGLEAQGALTEHYRDLVLDAAQASAQADSRDAARLDWLGENFFSDQKDEWDERQAPESIKWKFFGPMSVQGDIRRVIDAAMSTTGDAAIGEKGNG